ncbi:MAG: hypothetical protein J0I07_10925 [Myxococcales bacterium]|nr:hypothetical protein [Myxococcales bacterium]
MTGRGCGCVRGATLTATMVTLAAGVASAQPEPAPTPSPAPVTASAPQPSAPADSAEPLGPTHDARRLARDLETAPPPPSHVVYFQYGVAFAAEQVLAPGPVCDDTSGVPCILGAGGGVVVRGGWRSSGPLYLGGAYEMTKQDPNKLYRFALLQQARAEGRYYFMTARVTEPYAAIGLGVAGYGNEWAIDTWGPAGSIGAGIEYQITRRTVVGLAFAYRLLHFSRFTDTAGSERNPGIAQLLGLDLVLEQRDAIVRAGADATRSP